MLEQVIFSNIVNNEDYARKVLPFLKEEYFVDYSDKVLFNLIETYFLKYNARPTLQALAIELSSLNVNEDTFTACRDGIQALEVSETEDKLDWLVDKTEEFCKERALHIAIRKAISIIDQSDKQHTKDALPQILSDALAVSFDSSIGHDFLENFEERFEFYHRKESKVEFDLEYFNKITQGGVSKKTLNIILAGTGAGKSLFMCHCAAANLLKGLNVLYITLEMAEERIAERIDANLLGIPLHDLKSMPKTVYDLKMEKLKAKTNGKLVIKEYPTACAGSANFRHLINELRIKKNFVPDVIYIDYLNICMSSRIKNGANVNSYTLVKAIAEELRGLAVEFNVPVFSATQTTRSGYSNSDVGLEDTSESFGLPATADFMFALINSEEMEELGQIMVKQLKNRYSDPSWHKRFVIGIDRALMRLYNVDQSAQENISGTGSVADDKAVFDNSRFGAEDSERNRPKNKFNRKTFADFE